MPPKSRTPALLRTERGRTMWRKRKAKYNVMKKMIMTRRKVIAHMVDSGEMTVKRADELIPHLHKPRDQWPKP